jgi:hypothetical protein
MILSPALCRASRAMLAFDIAALVKKSGVPRSVIGEFEKGGKEPQARDLAALQRVFEEAGITYLDDNGNGPGLRLRSGQRGEGMRPEELNAENDD